jgi:hypothetical protein
MAENTNNIRFTIPQGMKKVRYEMRKMKPTKAHLPKNKNLRITMINEGIHKLMHNTPKRVYFPNLRYD